MWRHAITTLAASVAALCSVAAFAAPAVTTEEAMVPTAAAGVSVYVRNKRPESTTQFGPDRTLLFVHGATYPASTAFDLPLGGTSWMDELAEAGFDVYLVDLPGYGRSTRPADQGEPVTTTAEAVGAVDKVADWIRQRRGIEKLDVMGWSWGTAIMATFAQDHPEKVNRLVLYATLWHLKEPPPISAGGKMTGYRQVKRDAARARWLNGVPEDKKADLIPAGWFDQWADATWATDPAGAKQDPPVLNAANGVLADLSRYWAKGQSTWDPARITAPTLMVMGEWDHDTPPYMSQTVFPMLVHAPWKRFTMIGEGTHTLLMEKNRQQLFDVVRLFLTETAPTTGH
jgi:pimeloyl-ACP methyl ester carboxylesterase